MNCRHFIFIIAAVSLLTCVASALAPLTYYFNTTLGEDSSYSYSDVVRASSVALQLMTDRSVTCRYSVTKGTPYELMEEGFDLNLELIHKKNFVSLGDGLHRIYIRCKDSGATISRELSFSFSTVVPVSAKITLSADSPVPAGRTIVHITTSKPLSEPPVVSYAFDDRGYNALPVSGSGTEWTGYFVIPSTLGESAGSFKFFGRDVEGSVGEVITEGGIFFVDTIEPQPIVTINAQGGDGSISLGWYLDDDVSSYSIYRSLEASVGYDDFYKSTLSPSLTDTSVDRGKTYYYRVSAIDAAGNEGDLSREVWATVLLDNSSASAGGLSVELISLVDAVLVDIASLKGDITDISTSMNEKSERERNLFSSLKLEREITSARSELEVLQRDVERYKTQTLSRLELEKKLASARLKISTIKKKVPEQMIILSEKSHQKASSDQVIDTLMLDLYSTASEQERSQRAELSMNGNNEATVSVTVWGIALTYLDGTRSEFSAVQQTLPRAKLNETHVWVEYVNKEIASSMAEISVKNEEYEVLKDDPIFSFPASSETITYTFTTLIAEGKLSSLGVIPMYEGDLAAPKGGLTGYFLLGSDEGTHPYLGLSIAILLASGLFVYFIFMRSQRKKEGAITALLDEVLKLRKYVARGDFKEARTTYARVRVQYKTLSTQEQTGVYEAVQEAYDELNMAHIKDMIEATMKGNGDVTTNEEILTLYRSLSSTLQENLQVAYPSFFSRYEREKMG